MHTLFLLKPKLLAAQDETDCYTTDGYTVNFSGDCQVCRPYCEAICCSIFKFVPLTEEEAASGRYHYIEARADCNCGVCSEMRAEGVRYTLPKKADSSCVYLNEEKYCGIYEQRPQVCSTVGCRGWRLPLQPEI